MSRPGVRNALCASCGRCARLPRHAAAGIRRCEQGNLLIFCRVAGPAEILHVLHGARDHGRTLFPAE